MTNGTAGRSASANTQRAYAADWRHFCAWCRREGHDALAADAGTVALYLAACRSGAPAAGGRLASDATVARRLAGLVHGCGQRGLTLDRTDPRIAAALAGLRRAPAAARQQALRPAELRAMLDSCDPGSLRGLRDRAILLIGFATGLRRSEIAGLDAGPGQTADARGWVVAEAETLRITLPGPAGVRDVAIRRGPSPATCPVAALDLWLRLSRISAGPLFRRVTGQGREVGPQRLNDREVTRLVKRAALKAGLRGDLPEASRAALFSARSLRGSV